MDFNDTPQEAAFRAEVRRWLEANATERRSREDKFGAGLNEAEYLAAARAWQARKAAAGYAAIAAPKAMGGLGGTPAMQVVYGQEEAKFLVPDRVFEISLGTAVPTVAMWGTPEQKAKYLAPAFRGDHIWCALLSEPSAGSDLGNLRTRATRDGDEWVISGQKVWTSGAHFAQFGILLARSDWDSPKSKGLTMFIVDMKTPGIDVRPIHQASDEYHFNEVFLNDVRIPDSQRLGPEGQGWKVMLSTLMQERFALGNNFSGDLYAQLIGLAQAAQWNGAPAIENATVRAGIADAYIRQFGVELIVRRGMSAISKGESPGPEMAAVKLVGARAFQTGGALAIELGGAEGLIAAQDLGAQWRLPQLLWISAPGARIAGGTDEIQKNTIAEHVLGLPSEPRPDRDVPFRDLEHG
ncbi:MAG: acyl-CoA dehydrogenase [Novosphingobium sp. 28-62-57]|uniref:acyl-CoA dehydrogenase family protein n=1 Tax=unclassified Novosphingobium TaxID=2644732 RepID=UPI000BD8F4CC|nr:MULTISPECIES: acyl-CoA dehydrogenase family protein [unclassified Novosphingobium]OYW51149.1 MAG: acyl-CoA dehydrogenase [Novosphingobium sp. 12-62-10]OYZ11030.1 MAG: acyl-CoA dehydrogenase [Novosphingobium sp. 28-62-57]HQS70958.1 acyl-CoA dehydrogenase family protein [Novosphingobium sp.]